MGTQLRLVAATSALYAAMTVGAAAQDRPAVLELFTSEGCSSCPPAEAIVNALAKRPNVLALSFHVDYWDDLGWRDRYSLANATERQRRYARSLQRSSVYTPQVVIDGARDIVGSHGEEVAQALLARREGVATSLHLEGRTIRIQVGGASAAAFADVLLVGYLREAITPIGRGENAGRTLRESNVVLALRELGTWDGRPKEFELNVDALPANVTDVAVLVQSTGQGAILGAASMAVPLP